MSKFFIRNSGSWESPGNIYIGSGSGNQDVQKVHYYTGGNWEEVWPGLPTGQFSDEIIVDIHYYQPTVDGLPTPSDGYGNFAWQFLLRYPYDTTSTTSITDHDITTNPQFRTWYHPEWKRMTAFGSLNGALSDDIGSAGSELVKHIGTQSSSEYTGYTQSRFSINLSNLETLYPSSSSVWSAGQLPREYSNAQGIRNDAFHFSIFGYYYVDPNTAVYLDGSTTYYQDDFPMNWDPATTNPIIIHLKYGQNITLNSIDPFIIDSYTTLDEKIYGRYSAKLTTEQFDKRRAHLNTFGLNVNSENLTTYNFNLLEFDYSWADEDHQAYSVSKTPGYNQTTLPNFIHTVLKVDPDGGATYSGQNGIWNSFNHTAYIDTNDQTPYAVGNVNVWLETLPWDIVEQGAKTTSIQYLTSRGGKDSYPGLLTTDAARPIPDRNDENWWLDGNWGTESSNILEGMWSNHFSVPIPPPQGYSWSVNGYGGVEPPYSVFNIHQYQWDNPTVANVTVKIGGFWAANAATQTSSASAIALTFTSDSPTNRFGISTRATAGPIIQADGDPGVTPISGTTFQEGFLDTNIYAPNLSNITHQGNTTATISTTNSNGNAYIGPPAPSTAYDQNVYGAQSNFGQTITTIFIDYVNNTITVS